MSRTQDWIREGFSAEKRGDLAEAERCYRKELELKPRVTSAYAEYDWPKGDDVPLGYFENVAKYLEFLGTLRDIKWNPRKAVHVAKIRKRADLEKYSFISDLYISTEDQKYDNLPSLYLCRANGRKIARIWDRYIDFAAFEDLLRYIYGPRGHNCRLSLYAQERGSMFAFDPAMSPGGGDWDDSLACMHCNHFIPYAKHPWPGDPPYTRPERCPFCGDPLRLKSRRPLFRWVQYDPNRPILILNKLDETIQGGALLLPVTYEGQSYWSLLYMIEFLFLVTRNPLKFIQIDPGDNIRVEGARPDLLGPFTVYLEMYVPMRSGPPTVNHITRIFPVT